MSITRFFLLCFSLLILHGANAQNKNELNVNQATDVFNTLISQITKLHSIDLATASKETKDKQDFYNQIDTILSTTVMYVGAFPGDDSVALKVRARKEVISLYQSLTTINLTDLRLRTIDDVQDLHIFSNLSMSVRSKTFAVCFSQSTKPFMYLFMIPGAYIRKNYSRILSWKIVFTNGGYFFEDLIGRTGVESVILNGQ